ncbi:MAG: hypothetical protein AB8B66_03585 [Rickettsiaceae bacterium]
MKRKHESEIDIGNKKQKHCNTKLEYFNEQNWYFSLTYSDEGTIVNKIQQICNDGTMASWSLTADNRVLRRVYEKEADGVTQKWCSDDQLIEPFALQGLTPFDQLGDLYPTGYKHKKIFSAICKALVDFVSPGDVNNLTIKVLKYYHNSNHVIFYPILTQHNVSLNSLDKVDKYITNNYFQLTGVSKSMISDNHDNLSLSKNIWGCIAAYLKLEDVTLDDMQTNLVAECEEGEMIE